ncbi:MAG: RsmB/NOP family class I SAM-dependent RNA methyltransferase [Isosphaeraceae bacterium]
MAKRPPRFPSPRGGDSPRRPPGPGRRRRDVQGPEAARGGNAGRRAPKGAAARDPKASPAAARKYAPPVKSLTSAAGLIASIAPRVLRAVVDSHKRLEPALAEALEAQREIRRGDRRLAIRALSALFRWWGWIEPLRQVHIEDQLALAWLLDSSDSEGVCRIWAARAGHQSDGMMAAGDAPNWTGRAEALKRYVGARAVNADPWLLFPTWLRDQLPLPPGDVPAKARRLAFLHTVQSRWPLWVGVRGGSEKDIWNEIREAGLKPWVHRRLTTAARLEPETDLSELPSFRSGRLVIQDLASQAVGNVCDPDPGERWWDVQGGSGLHALHLGALMGNKGTVVTTLGHERQRHETAVRLRRHPFRNVAAKQWDGRHLPGKAGTFDGVLLDAPCSGVGHWRRHPETRWTIAKDDLPRLADQQRSLLDLACTAVRPGGTLVYTVATATIAETIEVIKAFLAAHPEFRLDPFPHPVEESTTQGTLQLWPHLHDSEARFLARMVRTATAP